MGVGWEGDPAPRLEVFFRSSFFFCGLFWRSRKDGTATERALFCPHTLANAAADIRWLWLRDHNGFWRGVEPRNRLERAREARYFSRSRRGEDSSCQVGELKEEKNRSQSQFEGKKNSVLSDFNRGRRPEKIMRRPSARALEAPVFGTRYKVL